MTNSELIKDRLTSMMIADRGSGAEKTLKVLRSDLYALLKDYMSLDPDNLSVAVSVAPGGYRVDITALTERFLDAGNTLE